MMAIGGMVGGVGKLGAAKSKVTDVAKKLESEKLRLSGDEYKAGVESQEVGFPTARQAEKQPHEYRSREVAEQPMDGDGVRPLSRSPRAEGAPSVDQLTKRRENIYRNGETALQDAKIGARAEEIRSTTDMSGSVNNRLKNTIYSSTKVGSHTFPPLLKRVQEPNYQFRTRPPQGGVKSIFDARGEVTPAGEKWLMQEAEATLSSGKAYGGKPEAFREATMSKEAHDLAAVEKGPENPGYYSGKHGPDDFENARAEDIPQFDNQADELEYMGIREPGMSDTDLRPGKAKDGGGARQNPHEIEQFANNEDAVRYQDIKDRIASNRKMLPDLQRQVQTGEAEPKWLDAVKKENLKLEEELGGIYERAGKRWEMADDFGPADNSPTVAPTAEPAGPPSAAIQSLGDVAGHAGAAINQKLQELMALLQQPLKSTERAAPGSDRPFAKYIEGRQR